MRKFKAMTAAIVLAMSCILVTACTSDPNTTAQTTDAQTNAQTEVQTDVQTQAQTDAQTDAQVEGDSITVSLRVEGTEWNVLYWDSYTTTATNVMALLQDAEELDSLTLTVDETSGYLVGINNEQAGMYGGWDGWLYRVNGEEPMVGMADYALTDGDEVIVYYGDPYGVGMQYPEITVENGVVTVTSQDAVYDADYNMTIVSNPVADATVSWKGESSLVVYMTDEQGQFTLKESDAVAGTYQVSVEKAADNGCPLVLRLSPDYEITLE